eukprot:5225359-Amphidinium_carterae.1
MKVWGPPLPKLQGPRPSGIFELALLSERTGETTRILCALSDSAQCLVQDEAGRDESNRKYERRTYHRSIPQTKDPAWDGS